MGLVRFTLLSVHRLVEWNPSKQQLSFRTAWNGNAYKRTRAISNLSDFAEPFLCRRAYARIPSQLPCAIANDASSCRIPTGMAVTTTKANFHLLECVTLANWARLRTEAVLNGKSDLDTRDTVPPNHPTFAQILKSSTISNMPVTNFL